MEQGSLDHFDLQLVAVFGWWCFQNPVEVPKTLKVEEASRADLNGDELGYLGSPRALLQELTVSCSLPRHCILHCCLKGYSEIYKVDRGQDLAPDDQVRSAVCAGEGGWEAVWLVGEVHCDLFLGAGMAADELMEQFKDCVMVLIVASAPEGHRAVVQSVQQGLAIKAEGAVGG